MALHTENGKCVLQLNNDIQTHGASVWIVI